MDIGGFQAAGALRLPGIFNPLEIDVLKALEVDRPGVRLGISGLSALIAPATRAAAALLMANARPVRAVLFDKTARSNWAVAWHQDRTIQVRERREAPGFGPWTRKGGLLHVAPPISVLEAMVTLRIHIDPVGADNAPLKVALGSHRLGLVNAHEAEAVATRLVVVDCLAEAGDVWAYSTPILHASDRAVTPGRRRVLQVDFSGSDLPGELQWAEDGAASGVALA